MSGLLAFLSKNFTIQTENLATEALTYILQNSDVARNTFEKLLNELDKRIAVKLLFKNQVYSEDQAIPDVIGFDHTDSPILIMEAKFWAGLTDHQPLTYIKRLPDSIPSVLMFIAPVMRFDSLWSELKNRSVTSYSFSSENTTSRYRSIKVTDTKMMVLTSWTYILEEILHDLRSKDIPDYQGDVVQLLGLCNEMDQEAFIPIKSSEISPGIAKRNVQYADLVDEVVRKGVVDGLYSIDGLRPTGGHSTYGRYFKMGDYCCLLKVDHKRWYKTYNTPLWLTIWGRQWKSAEEKKAVRLALTHYGNFGKMYIGDDGAPQIAIVLTLGEEKEKVIQDIFVELDRIKGLLDVEINRLEIGG